MKFKEVRCTHSILQTVFLLFISVRLRSSSSCTFSSCKISLVEGDGSKKTIDLNKYKNFLIYKEGSHGKYYDFQPCGTIASGDPENCLGFKGCQRETTTVSHPMGKKDSPSCKYKTGADPFLNFAGELDPHDDYKRGIKAIYVCDKNQPDLILELTGLNEIASGETTYEFSLTGKDACAKSGGGGGGDDSEGGGLDGASVFLIIFFLVIAVYLIAGLVYKGAVKGARGTEIIPNVEFWKQVPGFIRDGALFIYKSIASKFCNREYNQV